MVRLDLPSAKFELTLLEMLASRLIFPNENICHGYNSPVPGL